MGQSLQCRADSDRNAGTTQHVDPDLMGDVGVAQDDNDDDEVDRNLDGILKTQNGEPQRRWDLVNGVEQALRSHGTHSEGALKNARVLGGT
jgi:hypothetical protein